MGQLRYQRINDDGYRIDDPVIHLHRSVHDGLHIGGQEGNYRLDDFRYRLQQRRYDDWDCLHNCVKQLRSRRHDDINASAQALGDCRHDHRQLGDEDRHGLRDPFKDSIQDAPSAFQQLRYTFRNRFYDVRYHQGNIQSYVRDSLRKSLKHPICCLYSGLDKPRQNSDYHLHGRSRERCDDICQCRQEVICKVDNGRFQGGKRRRNVFPQRHIAQHILQGRLHSSHRTGECFFGFSGKVSCVLLCPLEKHLHGKLRLLRIAGCIPLEIDALLQRIGL